jgi:hypothetical protein
MNPNSTISSEFIKDLLTNSTILSGSSIKMTYFTYDLNTTSIPIETIADVILKPIKISEYLSKVQISISEPKSVLPNSEKFIDDTIRKNQITLNTLCIRGLQQEDAVSVPIIVPDEATKYMDVENPSCIFGRQAVRPCA